MQDEKKDSFKVSLDGDDQDTSPPPPERTNYSSTIKTELSKYHEKQELTFLQKYVCCCNTNKWHDWIANNLDSIINTFSITYDGITMIVSFMDLVTDILVLTEYYNKKYDYFFTTSLCIIIFAQLSYCVAFTLRYTRSSQANCQKFEVFLCCLPFSPIMSFIIYLVEMPNSCLAHRLQSWTSNLSFNNKNNNNSRNINNNNNNNQVNSHYYRNGDVIVRRGGDGDHHANSNYAYREDEEEGKKSAIRIWFEEKLLKHMGFILEALFEALPQSILQMIAIVYYNETDNIISIVSIFISLFSVISKSFVFSVSVGKDFLTIIFYWLCVITDFFGIFFAVAWVFYNPNNSNNNSVDIDAGNSIENEFISTIIGEIWFYKFSLIVLPIAVIMSFVCLFYIGLWLQDRFFGDICCIVCCCFVCIGPFVIAICLITIPPIFEIFTFVYIAMYFERTWMSRFPTTNAKNLNSWHSLISFMYDNKGYNINDIIDDFNNQFTINNKISFVAVNNDKKNNTTQTQRQTPFSCSGKKDRIIRICIINYSYYKGYSKIRTPNNFVDQYSMKRGKKVETHAHDFELRSYLDKEQKTLFMNINNYDQFLLHSGTDTWTHKFDNKTQERKKLTFWQKVWFIYGAPWRTIKGDKTRWYYYSWYEGTVCLIGLITFVLGPLYIISRLISVLFPVIIVIALLIEDLVKNDNDDDEGNVFARIDRLQWLMLGIYSFLEVIVIGLMILVMHHSYYESFLLPNNKFASLEPFCQEFVEYVTEYCYPRLMIAPIRDYLVEQVFGKDVGSIILSYLPDFNFDKDIGDFRQFLIECKGVAQNHKAFSKVDAQGFGSKDV